MPTAPFPISLNLLNVMIDSNEKNKNPVPDFFSGAKKLEYPAYFVVKYSKTIYPIIAETKLNKMIALTLNFVAN